MKDNYAVNIPTATQVANDNQSLLVNPIGEAEVQKALATLLKYKESKQNLENRIVENERWYKLRHWEYIKHDENEIEPVSAWLFNTLINKHADAMDNFPSCNILPREATDVKEAEVLSSIVPVILDQNDFEQTYSDVVEFKNKSGTGVYGVFWDSSKLNGLGDISVKQVDILNLFWEPGIKDIQKSRNIFHVELCDTDVLEEKYPELKGKLSGRGMHLSEYIHDDRIDITDKSIVVEWYYKKSMNGKQLLHYCKFVNNNVIYASENDPKYAESGWYNHGLYPFIFDPLYKVADSPAGFGYVDIGKSAQEFIDKGNKAILKNMLFNAVPRNLIREDGEVNEEEFANPDKAFIHVKTQNLGSDCIRPLDTTTIPSVYVDIITNKIDELKETTGNRDISTGGTTNGVTAASAIAAMQEAGGKTSRDSNKASYRAYKKLCSMVIELIRQFYDMPRYFRILGSDGGYEYITYRNENLKGEQILGLTGEIMGIRTPVFDLEISAQKQSPYSKLSQNELAIQFYGLGFFNPQMADQALACLEMMDFDRKNMIVKRISQNGLMYQQLMQAQQQVMMLASLLDKATGENYSGQLAVQFGTQPMPSTEGAESSVESGVLGEAKQKEPANTKQAKQRVAESTSPT